MTDLATLGVAPPDIPSKWDIIPIHASDVASFKRCRRYWDWTSPTRTNLRKRVELHGINFPLWFGSGIHYALEMYYNPALRRDPVEAFKTWYTIQWDGGVVTEDWFERIYDVNPKRIDTYEAEDSKPRYLVRGLRDLHPNPDMEEFAHHRELGIGMMEFYKEYAEAHDDFIVVAAESTFSVPILDPYGKVMMARDIREDSPNYGSMLEVHARGKRDAIVYSTQYDKYGVLDHKTASLINEAYFQKLEMDPQCKTYMWASQREAEVYNMPYTKVDFVIYQALWKQFPGPVILNANGTPSVDRQKQSCTAEAFEQAIKDGGLELWYEDNEKAKAFYEFLLESGDERYINRHTQFYNDTELYNTGVHMWEIAQEMLNPKVATYPSPDGGFLCINCAFRAPCLAKEDGSDWSAMLKDNYEENLDR